MPQNVHLQNIKSRLQNSQRRFLKSGVTLHYLKNYDIQLYLNHTLRNENIIKKNVSLVVSFMLVFIVSSQILNKCLQDIFSSRCLIPNNYWIWEMSRPLSDCQFCKDIQRPIIIYNVTQEIFKDYVYTSRPIIIKDAIKHWKALDLFTYEMFKKIHETTTGAYDMVEENCQFLNFKSDLYSLREVFQMTSSRASNQKGEKSWYVGWENCHPDILDALRKYYELPKFLPEDSEFPNTENIFFGYEEGAVMHLDYIPRLMWQGQVRGNKTWTLVPVTECDGVCQSLQFYVEPGDIVFVDTRVWYHATKLPPGQFSITVQSEYG